MSEEAIEAHRNEIADELRKEYGGEFEAKLERANDLLREFEAPDLSDIQLADGTLLGDNAELTRFIVRLSDYVAEQMSEDQLAGRDSRPGISESDLQARISEMTAKNSPYWEKMHPDHDRIVNEVFRLREQLHG